MKTQGIKYAGSKAKLISHIISNIKELPIESTLDGFSGTTRVSQAFAKSGYTVTSNDLSEYSKVFGQCYLLNKNKPSYYVELLSHLNSLKGYHGWFSENYGGLCVNGSSISVDGKKKLWQLHNTFKLDAILDEIEKLKLEEITKSVVLSSLMLAMDEVDNTMGHFTSYLKNWSKRSYHTIELKVPELIIDNMNHNVIQGDVLDSIKSYHDLAYFDPPYSSNNEKMPASRVRYASYYHVWETICKNDKPELFGAANRRIDSSDKVRGSTLEEFRKDANGNNIVTSHIRNLIQNTNARYIMFSYSSGGRTTLEELIEIFKSKGNLMKTIQIDYKQNVMANMKWTNDWLRDNQSQHQEYIFLIETKG